MQCRGTCVDRHAAAGVIVKSWPGLYRQSASISFCMGGHSAHSAIQVKSLRVKTSNGDIVLLGAHQKRLRNGALAALPPGGVVDVPFSTAAIRAWQAAPHNGYGKHTARTFSPEVQHQLLSKALQAIEVADFLDDTQTVADLGKRVLRMCFDKQGFALQPLRALLATAPHRVADAVLSTTRLSKTQLEGFIVCAKGMCVPRHAAGGVAAASWRAQPSIVQASRNEAQLEAAVAAPMIQAQLQCADTVPGARANGACGKLSWGSDLDFDIVKNLNGYLSPLNQLTALHIRDVCSVHTGPSFRRLPAGFKLPQSLLNLEVHAIGLDYHVLLDAVKLLPQLQELRMYDVHVATADPASQSCGYIAPFLPKAKLMQALRCLHSLTHLRIGAVNDGWNVASALQTVADMRKRRRLVLDSCAGQQEALQHLPNFKAACPELEELQVHLSDQAGHVLTLSGLNYIVADRLELSMHSE